MRRLLVALLFLVSSICIADESYLGLYINGQKVGYSGFVGSEETLNGAKVRKSVSTMLFSTQMLGTDMQMRIDGTTWADLAGKPIRMVFDLDSAGRTQRMEAAFSKSTVKLTMTNGGNVTTKTLDLPPDAPIVDDALGALLLDKVAPGDKRDFYILDPTTTSLVKNTVTINGPTKVVVDGVAITATMITVKDPRADTKVYLNAKGEFLLAEGPMGIVMKPEPKEVAMRMASVKGSAPKIDIAEWTSIKPDRTLKDPSSLRLLEIGISGRDLSQVPSDEHQSVALNGKEWRVTIHPNRWSNARNPDVAAIKADPKWRQPSLHVNSNLSLWKARVREAVNGKSTFKEIVEGVHRFVFQRMTPNAGIGVLRDATEVFDTHEGVCRDYAILTATMLRAAGVPARLASGLVSWDGTFYYHAWVEAWDGKSWYAVDSTSPDIQVSAAHVKLSDGNVEEAFTFPFLGQVKIRLLDARRG